MLSGCYLSHIFINLCLSDSNILTKVLKCISTNIWLQHGGYVHLFYAVHYYNATILGFFFFTFYKCSTKLLNVIQLYTKGHDYLLHSEHSKMVKKKKRILDTIKNLEHLTLCRCRAAFPVNIQTRWTRCGWYVMLLSLNCLSLGKITHLFATLRSALFGGSCYSQPTVPH